MEHLASIAASQWTNWRTYKNCDPTWFYSALGLSVLAIICLLAGSIDDRLYNGVSVWSKPFKFGNFLLCSLERFIDPGVINTFSIF